MLLISVKCKEMRSQWEHSVQKNIVIVIRIWLWEFIFSGPLFSWDIRFHLKINNIFKIAYFYSGFSIKICMQDDIGYTCDPLQEFLNTNVTKVLKIPCTLNGSAEFRETESCRLSVIHLRNWILEYKKMYVEILYSCYL